MATRVTDLHISVLCTIASVIIGAMTVKIQKIKRRHILLLMVSVVDSSGNVSKIEVHEWLRRHGLTLGDIGNEMVENGLLLMEGAVNAEIFKPMPGTACTACTPMHLPLPEHECKLSIKELLNAYMPNVGDFRRLSTLGQDPLVQAFLRRNGGTLMEHASMVPWYSIELNSSGCRDFYILKTAPIDYGPIVPSDPTLEHPTTDPCHSI